MAGRYFLVLLRWPVVLYRRNAKASIVTWKILRIRGIYPLFPLIQRDATEEIWYGGISPNTIFVASRSFLVLPNVVPLVPFLSCLTIVPFSSC